MSPRANIIKRLTLLGSGAGLALGVIYGLLQGIAIGGTAGLLLANEIFGTGVIEIWHGELFTRVIVGGSMLTGAIVSLIVFLAAGSALGAACGYILSLTLNKEAGQADTGPGKYGTDKL